LQLNVTTAQPHYVSKKLNYRILRLNTPDQTTPIKLANLYPNHPSKIPSQKKMPQTSSTDGASHLNISNTRSNQ